MQKFSGQTCDAPNQQTFAPQNYVHQVTGDNSVQVAQAQQLQVNNGGATMPVSGIYHNGTWYNAQTLNFQMYESRQELQMEEEPVAVGEAGGAGAGGGGVGGGAAPQIIDGIQYSSTFNNSQVYTYSNYVGQQSAAIVNEPQTQPTFYYQPYNYATQLGGNPTTAQYEYQPYQPQQIIQNVVPQPQPPPQPVQIAQQPQELPLGATYYQPYAVQPYAYQVPELPAQPQPQPQMQLQLQQVQLVPPPQPQQQQVTHQAVTPTVISVNALRDSCDPSIIEIDISSASEVYITRTPMKLIITIYRQRGTEKPDMTQKVSINGQQLKDLFFKVNTETESQQNGDQENREEPKSQTEQETLNNDTIEENLEVCESQDMLGDPEICLTSVESLELEASENQESFVKPKQLMPPEACTISVESPELNPAVSVESDQFNAAENLGIPVESSELKAPEIPTTAVDSLEHKIRIASIESAQHKNAENRKTSTVEQMTPGFKAFNVNNPSTLPENLAQTTDHKSKQNEVVVIEMERNAKQISNMEATKLTKDMEQFRAPRRIVNHQSIEHNLFKLDAIRGDGKCDKNNNINNTKSNSTIVDVVRLLSTKSKTHNADHAIQDNIRSTRKISAPEDSAKIPPQESKFAQENAKIMIQKISQVTSSVIQLSRENIDHSEEKPELDNAAKPGKENEPKSINLAGKEKPEIVAALTSEIIADIPPDDCPIEDSKLAQVILGKIPIDSHLNKPKISLSTVNSTAPETAMGESQLNSNLATPKETTKTASISKPKTFKEIISKALAQPTVRKPKAVKKQVIFSTAIPIIPNTNPGSSSSSIRKIIQQPAAQNIFKDKLTTASQSNINQIQTNQGNSKITTASNMCSNKPLQASQSNDNQTTANSQETLKTSVAPNNSKDKTTHVSQSNINQASNNQDIVKTTTASNISIVKPVQAFQSTVNQTTTNQDIIKDASVAGTLITSIDKSISATLNQVTINQDIFKTNSATKTPNLSIDKPVQPLPLSINQSKTSQDKAQSASNYISLDKSTQSGVNQAKTTSKIVYIDKPIQSLMNQATALKILSIDKSIRPCVNQAPTAPKQDIFKATTSKILSIGEPIQSTVNQANTSSKEAPSKEQVAKKSGNSKHTPKSAPKQKRGKIDSLILDSMQKEPESIQPFGNNQQRNSKKQNNKLSKLERKAIKREVKQIEQLQATEKKDVETVAKSEKKKEKSEGKQSIGHQSKEKQSDEKKSESENNNINNDNIGSGEDSDSSGDSQMMCPLLKAVQDAQLRRTLVRIINKLNCL